MSSNKFKSKHRFQCTSNPLGTISKLPVTWKSIMMTFVFSVSLLKRRSYQLDLSLPIRRVKNSRLAPIYFSLNSEKLNLLIGECALVNLEPQELIAGLTSKFAPLISSTEKLTILQCHSLQQSTT